MNNYKIKNVIFFLLSVVLILYIPGFLNQNSNSQKLYAQNITEDKDGTIEKVVLAVHGGTGSGTVSQKNKEDYVKDMTKALQTGKDILDKNGSSEEAVVAAVKVLEDSPVFNAGKGAVFNTNAEHELDASIMNGKDLQAGAVSGVQHTKNPIELARAVMNKSEHVMLSGNAADWFARENNLEMVTQDYYFTQKRWDSLMKAKDNKDKDKELGTVGAISRDNDGNLSAATSTGGLTNKYKGRVGDSPIIGAGTYADNESVAVSATGTGEVFIRGTATSEISSLVKYANYSLKEATEEVIYERLLDIGGTGGVIALNKLGEFYAPYSTKRMAHGYVTESGEIVVVVNADDDKNNYRLKLERLVSKIKDENLKEEDFDKEKWNQFNKVLTEAKAGLDENLSTAEYRELYINLEKSYDDLNRQGSAITTSDLIKKVQEKEDEFSDSSEYRKLNIQLEIINRFEKQEQLDKALKHLEGFEILLEDQKENEVISQQVFDEIMEVANELKKNWK